MKAISEASMPAQAHPTASPASPSSDDTSPHKRRKTVAAIGSNRKKNGKPKRKYIPTHTTDARQVYNVLDEIDRLVEEKKQLEAMMKGLEDVGHVFRPREALQRRQQTNNALREAMYTQRRAIAGASSIVAHHFSEKSTEPFDVPTKLSIDPVELKAALMEMREQRLSCAYEFMMEMLRYRNTSLDFCEQKKFAAINGDICSERFEIVPLPKAQTVKGVFDAVKEFMSAMEIMGGDITIRENEEPQLSINAPSLSIVAEYRPPGPGVEEVGFSINDTIDEDELYPYKPATRVRQDVTAIR